MTLCRQRNRQRNWQNPGACFAICFAIPAKAAKSGKERVFASFAIAFCQDQSLGKARTPHLIGWGGALPIEGGGLRYVR